MMPIQVATAMLILAVLTGSRGFMALSLVALAGAFYVCS